MGRNKIFGWSLPPGVSTLPGEELESPYAYKCPACGAFVRMIPTRFEPWEDSIIGSDGKKEIFAAGFHDFYTCSKCDLETKDIIPCFAK